MKTQAFTAIVLMCAFILGGCGDKNGKVCSVDWSSQPEWRLDTLAVAQKVAVNGIWGVNQNEVYAVGTVDSGQGPIGVIWKYNGTRWSEFYTRPNSDLRDIHGASSNSIWVAGIDGTGTYPGGALVLHWSGSDWLESPPAPPFAGLLSIWTAVDQDVYAIDRSGRIIRYDGAVWTEEVTPVQVDPPFTLFDGTDIWGTREGGDLIVYAGLAIGNLGGIILRRGASGWDADFLAPNSVYPSVFVGIWAGDSDLVYALESTGRGAVPVGNVYQRTDTGWVSTSLFGVTQLFSGLRGDGEGGVFAYGWALYRLQGTSWTLYEDYPSDRPVFFEDVWIHDPGIFAVGQTGRSDLGVALIGDFSTCRAGQR